jgi:hypothetical protein
LVAAKLDALMLGDGAVFSPIPEGVIPRPTPCPSEGALTFKDDDEAEPGITEDNLFLLFLNVVLMGDVNVVKLIFREWFLSDLGPSTDVGVTEPC